MDLATHDIDLTQWVTGSPIPHRIRVHRRARAAGRHEDLVAVSGMLRDGTVTSHLVNWLSSMKERVVTVTGERGCLTRRHARDRAVVPSQRRQSPPTVPLIAPFRGASEGDVIRYAVAKREALVAELENFRDAVLGKPADIVTMRQGLETVEVASRGPGRIEGLRRCRRWRAGQPAHARPAIAGRPACFGAAR